MPLNIILVDAEAGTAVMPQVQQMKGPLELSVFLIGASAEAATAFRADGVLVSLDLPCRVTVHTVYCSVPVQSVSVMYS